MQELLLVLNDLERIGHSLHVVGEGLFVVGFWSGEVAEANGQLKKYDC